MSVRSWLEPHSIEREVNGTLIEFFQVNTLFMRRYSQALRAIMQAWNDLTTDESIQGVSQTYKGVDEKGKADEGEMHIPQMEASLFEAISKRRSEATDILVERLTEPKSMEALAFLVVASARKEFPDRSQRDLDKAAAKLIEDAPAAVLLECVLCALEAQHETFEDFGTALRDKMGSLREGLHNLLNNEATQEEEEATPSPTLQAVSHS